MTSASIYRSPDGEKAVMAFYDAMLAHWALPYETLTIPTRHGQTFVIASGPEAAPPLVLLHGAGTNSAIWAGDVAEYGRDHRVYAVDLLGEPGKSAPNRPAWDSPAYAKWLDDVLAGLKIDKASFTGISQGAWTALKFATSNPERVEKLVLMCPGGVIPDKISFIFKVIPLSMLGRWGLRRINRMLFAGQPVSAEVEEAVIMITTHFKSRMGVLPIFSDEELRRLTMPVLLLMGDQDALRDAEKIAGRLQTLLPHLVTTIIPGGGHALVNTTGFIVPFLAATMHA